MITLNRARRADLTEHADFALGRSSVADSPAVKDQHVRQHRPIFPRDERHQLPLHFHGIRLASEPEAETESPNVCIDDHAFVFPERVPQNHVGSLAPDTWEFDQSLHRVRNCTAMALDQRFAESDQALRLVTEKPCAFDDLLQLFPLGVGQRLRGGKSLEERGCNHVDALVGALCAQDRRHQQLKRRFVIELTVRIRVSSLEARENLGRTCLLSHRPRLFRANPTTSSALRVLRISPASNHAFLAIPIPKWTLSSAAVEWASGPISINTPR